MLKTPINRYSFLDIDLHCSEELKEILELASKIKSAKDGTYSKYLCGKQVCILLMKNSTRTRVSFETGINRLGGDAVILYSRDTQLSRGESVEDTARVLGKYLDMIIVRCYEHSFLETFDMYSGVPVINALSDNSHPCQIMADILTYSEKKGDISDSVVCWVGNCNNNVLNSWFHASKVFGFQLTVSSPDNPENFIPGFSDIAKWEKNPGVAVSFADVVVTDSWISMGDKEKVQVIMKKMAPYSVNSELMSHTKEGTLFMHCLPAHRGEEVSEDVIDSENSMVFFQAENRLYAQQAIMIHCLR